MLDNPDEVHIAVEGSDLTQLTNESGCHKIQRVPPTERKGRVHTSTVTVAVINVEQYNNTKHTSINPKDMKVEWYSGTGCGGQYRNKHQNSVRLTHIHTGIVQTAQTRSRESSYAQALESLTRLLNASARSQTRADISRERKNQIGNSSNTNVVRTYCFQHGLVKNTNGKTISIKQFEKGQLDLLWD